MLSKKVLLACLAATASLTLAACTPAQGNNDGTTPNTQSTAPNDTTMRQNPFNRVGFRNNDGMAGNGFRNNNRNVIPDDGVQGITNANPNLVTGRNPNSANNVFLDADRMAEVAAAVDGVENATAVIVGATAYVGLDLDPQVGRRKADAVEEEVARRVNRAVPRYHVIVTSDVDMLGQLTEIDNGLRAGRPIEQFRDQLDVINQRLSEARTHRAPVR
ncbi:MAG: YhcN/YlaJ family sporulation lipoprotein [Bacillota bacterium]|nr:hypothetical protein [Bacillota bacterium]